MSIRTVYALESRELDEDVAEANDQRRNKNISEPKACPFCKGSDRPFLFVDEDDLKIHILRFHTGQPSTEGKTLARLVKNGRV